MAIVELEIVKRTKSYNLWLVFLPIHCTKFTQRCLHEAISLNWTECPHAAKTTWTYLNSELVLFSSALQVSGSYTYGSVKIIFETKINCFAFSKPKSTILFVKQRKTNSKFWDKITSARVIISCCHGKNQNPERFPSGFRARLKTHLKPHFAHFRTFLNIFEQNEWQIRFSQPILC